MPRGKVCELPGLVVRAGICGLAGGITVVAFLGELVEFRAENVSGGRLENLWKRSVTRKPRLEKSHFFCGT